MRHASLGRLSWSPGTGEGPAGLPLLRVPHLLVCFKGVTKPGRRTGHHCQHRAGGGIGDSARPGMLASELPTIRERSEPDQSFDGESPEGDDPLARAWAGVRPRKNGGGCRVANPAGSRAEPGRRRPGPPARLRPGRRRAGYAARRSGRKGAVTSSNHGCWRMVRARRSMRA